MNDSILAPGSNYLCGDAITIADYYGASFVHLGEVTGADYAAYPNVKAWLGRMKALKSWDEVYGAINGYADSLKANPMVAV